MDPTPENTASLEAAHIIPYRYYFKTPTPSAVVSSAGSSSQMTSSEPPAKAQRKESQFDAGPTEREQSNRSPVLVASGGKAWQFLVMFTGDEERLLRLLTRPRTSHRQAGHANQPLPRTCPTASNQMHNGILLHHEAHVLFDNLYGWIEPHVYDP